MRRSLLSCLLCLCLLSIGCLKSTPEELRGLVPVTITVLKDGKPLDDVRVSLIPEKTAADLLVYRGSTDSGGVATIETVLRSDYAPGAKPGNYRVALSKNFPLPAELEERENEMDMPEREKAALDAKRTEYYKQHRVVPPVLSDRRNSPLQLTVAEKTGATLTADVAEY